MSLEVNIKFDTEESRETFLEMLSFVIGVSIDGKNEIHWDSYGNELDYISPNKNELTVKETPKEEIIRREKEFEREREKFRRREEERLKKDNELF